MAVLQDLRLRRELDELRRKREEPKPVNMKIGPKGGLSVYGFGVYPVTLYKEQWLRLLDMAPEIRDFIARHSDQMKGKS